MYPASCHIRPSLIAYSESKLRKPIELSLGPQYKGSSVSRHALLADEDDGAEDQSDGLVGSEDIQSLPDEGEGQEDFAIGDSSDDQTHQRDPWSPRASSSKGRISLANMEDLDIQSEVDEDVVHTDDPEEDDLSPMNSPLYRRTTLDADSTSSFSDTNDSDDITSAETDTDGASIPEDDEASDPRAAIRKMMAEESKTVAATVSEAAQADVEKGKAIKHQRSTFDTLLNTRIRLQKALVATNSMTAEEPIEEVGADVASSLETAETAALDLWDTISKLRSSLPSASSSKKRPFSATFDTPTSTLWNQTQALDSASLPQRRAVLTKWSHRTQPISTLSSHSKFSNSNSQQPLTSVLDATISNKDPVARTHVPRSCAPLQAARKVQSDPEVYDDADFYALLLRELVDQRMASSALPFNPSDRNKPSHADLLPTKLPKVRKVVDKKASKGRKMRYGVHEKLQNFMMREEVGEWGEKRRRDFFASLLGVKKDLSGGRSGDEMSDVDGFEGVKEEEEGLRLFRG